MAKGNASGNKGSGEKGAGSKDTGRIHGNENSLGRPVEKTTGIETTRSDGGGTKSSGPKASE